MHFRKIKKNLIILNLALVALAAPLYWGSGWLQANVFKTSGQAVEKENLTPQNTVVSTDALDLKIYDNFSNGQIPGRFQKMVIEHINNAREEIIIAMYAFDIVEIRDALIAAKNRGVKIKLLYTAAKSENINPFLAGLAEEISLIRIGENIDSVNYSMHHKFMLIDPETENRSLLAGSWNWTSLQEELDPNLLMETSNREIIESYRREAERLATGNNGYFKFRLTDFRPWSDLITFSNARVEVWFSPGRDKYSIQNRVISMIDAAQQQIDIANTIIDSSFIADGILKKAGAGVKVRVIFNREGVDNQQPLLGYLKKHKEQRKLANLEIVIGGEEKANELGQFSIFHHHFMVVDGYKVLTGTANWTYGGFFLNDEDFLVIESAEIAQKFSEIFDYYFLKYRG